MSTNNNISIKEYNEMNKKNDLRIEIEKKSSTLKLPQSQQLCEP